eukprot:5485908-Pyramimonas_sp.AAC.1
MESLHCQVIVIYLRSSHGISLPDHAGAIAGSVASSAMVSSAGADMTVAVSFPALFVNTCDRSPAESPVAAAKNCLALLPWCCVHAHIPAQHPSQSRSRPHRQQRELLSVRSLAQQTRARHGH